MAWVNLASESDWSRIFDFGNDTNTCMFLTPQNGFDDTARFGISTSGSGGEQDINCPMAMGIGGWHQVAVTLNSGTGILYVDGAAVGTNASMNINPSSLGATTNNYIGRSQSASDPYLDGSIDEFRIYNLQRRIVFGGNCGDGRAGVRPVVEHEQSGDEPGADGDEPDACVAAGKRRLHDAVMHEPGLR